MEEKQTRVMLILAAVLVALVMFLRFVDPPKDEPEGSEELSDLINVEPDLVAKLTLTTAEGTLEAERTPEGWILLQPSQARADDNKLDQLVGMVDRLQANPPMAGADKAKYGLEDPRATLTLALTDGKSHTVAIGALSPVGFKTYVSLDGGDVQVASGDPGASATAPFASYRDSTVLRFAVSAVTELRFEDANGAWHATRRGQDWWLDDGRRADGRVLDRLVEAANGLRFESFFPELSMAEAGLEPPMATLTLKDDQGDIVLRIGAERAGGTIVVGPEGVVGTVGSVAELSQALGQLLEERLLPITPMDLQRLTVELDGARVEWLRDADAWLRDGQIDPRGADTVINTLLDAKADRAARPEALGAVSGRVEAATADAKVVVTLGASTDAGRVGQDEAGGPLYMVPAATVAELAAMLSGEAAAP